MELEPGRAWNWWTSTRWKNSDRNVGYVAIETSARSRRDMESDDKTNKASEAMITHCKGHTSVRHREWVAGVQSHLEDCHGSHFIKGILPARVLKPVKVLA
ncbi:hypothetical protein M413DRAFT_440283 [Hebeloma cylindrosporum]|uniref:Uncharacterized protein n=1 Tax=Hebeloma cylindrosporum TaxID=76867 RepID=A0A0C2Z0K8_HEBCY|nr:hypothetical protein M413DRAFT_440283 [Hebeloma cylindrosporum h7]